jgi:DNA-binding transcriptional ArsR family regulator
MAEARNGKDHDDTDALIDALNHPLRREILQLFLNREGQLSPLEASEALDWPLPTVGYHFRVLLKDGAVQLTEERPRRGSIQHFYIATEALKQAAWIRQVLAPDDSTTAA